ncbi:MAG: peptidase U32 family protein [Nanoarchaeota archaeon]
MQKHVEITSPVGSYETLNAAIKAKTDSIYFGIEQLNMRARSINNFTLKDLPEISKICKENNVKTYIALNTIMYDHDMTLMKKICDEAKRNKITAVIASDTSAIEYARSIGMTVHCSTQMNIANTEAVKFYSRYADTIVLARELTLNQIKKICDEIKKQEIKGPNGELVKIEIFVHGALCVAVSGKCYMSLATYNSSANRGSCLQNCRRSYKVTDEETGDELVIDNKYIMSPKDLCTIGFIDKLIESGASIFKIEGRGKPPEYVYTTTKAYKEAIDSYYNKTYTEDKIKNWIKELEKVYNRGFWQGGYYLGKKLGEWSGAYGSKATREKILLGKVNNYYNKTGIAEIEIQSGMLNKDDELLITGPTTGVVQTRIKDMMIEKEKTEHAKKNEKVTIPIKEKLRRNDRVFILKEK